MNDNVKQFLENIQDLQKEKFTVKQISSGNNVDCKPLTFKQQKDLISTVAEGTLGVIKFQKILNDILLENTESNDLLITDKIPIILKLRSESIGNEIKIDGQLVNFEKNITEAEKMTFNKANKVSGKIEVELAIPTISEENKILNHTIETLKKDGEKDTGKNITNIYTFEIIKFIKSIKFGDSELVFSDIPVRDRVKVVENLPLTTNKEIIKYIEDVKKIESDSLIIYVDGDQKSIDIDVSFFDN